MPRVLVEFVSSRLPSTVVVCRYCKIQLRDTFKRAPHRTSRRQALTIPLLFRDRHVNHKCHIHNMFARRSGHIHGTFNLILPYLASNHTQDLSLMVFLFLVHNTEISKCATLEIPDLVVYITRIVSILSDVGCCTWMTNLPNEYSN